MRATNDNGKLKKDHTPLKLRTLQDMVKIATSATITNAEQVAHSHTLTTELSWICSIRLVLRTMLVSIKESTAKVISF